MKNLGVFKVGEQYFVYEADDKGEATGDPKSSGYATPEEAKTELEKMMGGGMQAASAATAAAPRPVAVKGMQADPVAVLAAKNAALEQQVAALSQRMNAPAVAAGGFANVRPANEGKPFRTFGDQLKAIAIAGMGKEVDPRLEEVNAHHKAAIKAIQGSNESIASEGGWAVQTDFEPQIIKRSYEVGQLAKLCRKTGISSNANGINVFAVDETSRVRGSRVGGVQVYWLGEGGAPTKSKPKLHKVAFDLGTLVGLWYATEQLLNDQSALTSLAMEAFPEEIAYEVDEAILNGIGGDIPLGINTHTNALVVVPAEGGQPAKSVLTRNISNMWASMSDADRQKAVWVANQELDPTLDELAIPVGTAALEPRFVKYNDKGLIEIKGRPLIYAEQAKAPGTQGDFMLVNFDAYRLIEKDGVQTASSIHVEFLSAQTAFRFLYRINGRPEVKSKVAPANGLISKSPYVVLAAR